MRHLVRLGIVGLVASCGVAKNGPAGGVAWAACTGPKGEEADEPCEIAMIVPPEGPSFLSNDATGPPPMVSTQLVAPYAGEGLLNLRARGPGTDWGDRGRESAVVSVFLDGAHNQDIILYRGEELANYEVPLGRVAPGSHQLEVRYRPDLSSPGARLAEVQSVSPIFVSRQDPQYEPLATSPIIYARPNANRSDTPLFLTYERLATGLQYTLVASNEDGGTPTADLLARYGRACDIDWAYRQAGSAGTGFYQGFLHRTLHFRGAFEAKHPILRVSTTNNMFSDDGKTRFKLRPPILPAPIGSRERILDSLPWVYGITGRELIRERKVRPNGGHSNPLSWALGTKVADTRRYITVEFAHPGGGIAIGFRLLTKVSPSWQYSTGGRASRAIARPGLVRTGIELPFGSTPHDIVSIEPTNGAGRPLGQSIQIVRAFSLATDFSPVSLPDHLGLPGPQ